MDISLGILAAIFWGATDFLVGLNARNVGIRRSVFFSQIIGLIMLSLIFLYQPARLADVSTFSLKVWLSAGTAACATVAGALALSKAFIMGKATVIAPIITSYGAFTTLLSLASGEFLSIQQLFGLAFCLIGVTMTASNDTDETGKRTNGAAVFYAVLAAMLYGVSFWLQGLYALPVIGPVLMLWLLYATGTAVATVSLLGCIRNFSAPTMKSSATLLSASLFNLVGFSAFALGASMGSLSVVTVVSTLSGGIAAFLGFVFFKEAIRKIQFVGILLAIIGAAFLHLNA